jgi:hypothetical protein
MEKSNQRNNLVPNGCVALLVGFKKWFSLLKAFVTIP